jgi:hypothetical protein
VKLTPTNTPRLAFKPMEHPKTAEEQQKYAESLPMPKTPAWVIRQYYADCPVKGTPRRKLRQPKKVVHKGLTLPDSAKPTQDGPAGITWDWTSAASPAEVAPTPVAADEARKTEGS